VIRRIRLDDVEAVADLYVHEYARDAGELGKAPISVWLNNSALHPKAFCLVAEEASAITGFVIASLRESPVLPGMAGELDELWTRDDDGYVAAQLVSEAIARLRRLGASTVRADVASQQRHGPVLERLGFEADTVRYSLYE
jgi:L-amino acid N-acyltransferase YncA